VRVPPVLNQPPRGAERSDNGLRSLMALAGEGAAVTGLAGYVRTPRDAAAGRQDTLASRYPPWIRVLVMAAFTLTFLGWLNESWLFLWESPVWLNRYTEYAIILAFGLWRIRAERNRYTRRRLVILVSVVTGIWWLIPWLNPFFEPYVGFLWVQPVFPSVHTPGTLSFVLVLALVFLFGRRVICGFGCPCVGIRETVGFAYRSRTLRGPWVWRLRHVKWLFFVWYVGVMVATQFPPSAWTVSLVGAFGLTVGLTYFGSFFPIPLTGNRFYCRYLCPYGATFGLLNHAGFYGLEMDTGRCIDCRRCEQACDMGIPVWAQGKAHGRVTGLEDCMGCARCVVSCPTDALAVRDVRNLFRPALRQDASRLLGEAPVAAVPRETPAERPPAERASDWRETHAEPDLTHLARQAARCLDCAAPRRRAACRRRSVDGDRPDQGSRSRGGRYGSSRGKCRGEERAGVGRATPRQRAPRRRPPVPRLPVVARSARPGRRPDPAARRGSAGAPGRRVGRPGPRRKRLDRLAGPEPRRGRSRAPPGRDAPVTRTHWLRLVLLLVLAGGVAVVVGLREHLDVAQIEARIRALGAWAPLGFIALYAIGAVLFTPDSVLTLAGGARFGPVWGTLVNLAGATLGATLAFLIARHLASDWARTRSGSGSRVSRPCWSSTCAPARTSSASRATSTAPSTYRWSGSKPGSSRSETTPSARSRLSAAPTAARRGLPTCSPGAALPTCTWCSAA
jgi:polyferredoxin